MDERLAETIGVEAYTFLYPLVLTDTTRRQMTNVERVGEAPGRGPADVFVNIPAFPAADFRGVVRPNFDSLHWIAWLDLHRERVASLPAASDNYYLLPLGDMWGEISLVPAPGRAVATPLTSRLSVRAGRATCRLGCDGTTLPQPGYGSSAARKPASRPTTGSPPSRPA